MNGIQSEDRECVWDYPRPPRLELSSGKIRVLFQGVTIATTTSAYRVLETSHPPTWYIPPRDVRTDCLIPAGDHSLCEFKGRATYWDLQVGSKKSRHAAWSYPNPHPTFQTIRDYLAFYPSRVDDCFVDGEQVKCQEGDFYGGWITTDIVGPFKGGAGTWGW